MTEDEMVGRHHSLHGHEFEQALGVGEGQGGLAYCSPCSPKESDMTEELNNKQQMRSWFWVGKISWRGKWQCTPVCLPGESHGQRSIVSYDSP